MTTNNIFIIDSRVADYQRLMAALPVGSEAFLLNPNQDGVEQMQAILSNYSNLDSIQIISHGAQGDKGRQFIDRLALFTAADVAASDDLTDNAD